ncbi:Woronin body major protein [Colletotrichum orbiculare MAFF 240422]|uniref:Woronin body major protein n=1 Tax=Colletotrichum orbiculare (strain 104-T / ATCC 96160 / CBS 514.97 / LARS 414 / MAFF 240422) TaxID=1213857 RepID=A0A484FBX1_COLOR|nr:Woronin body major protein [Colletotrichum orbiculare MAFF 240422]
MDGWSVAEQFARCSVHEKGSTAGLAVSLALVSDTPTQLLHSIHLDHVFPPLAGPTLQAFGNNNKIHHRLSPLCALKAANLDFEARVPVPFSVFPSTYKESEAQTQTQTQTQTVTETHEEIKIELPQKPQKPGRPGDHSAFTTIAEATLPPRKEQRFSEEEVRIEEHHHHHHRPGPPPTQYQPPAPAVHHESHTYREEYRPIPQFHTSEFHDTRVQVDNRHHEHLVNPIDTIERQYRQRFRPSYHREEVTVKQRPYPAHSHHSAAHSHHSQVDDFTVESSSERPRPQVYKETIKVTEETVEPTHVSPPKHKSKMGYYDDDARYEASEVRSSASRRPSPPPASTSPNTVTIPCHHIRLGDFLMLQGRPCQVIKISTSAATGQYRYLGVDLFTKQLHEESSFISNPAPSVVVQTMLGPVFKQYRVLDLADGHVVAMTETGDVKQGLPVIDQSNLWTRLNSAFDSGRGSVRVLVLNDAGRELAVDVKVIHGSRL